MNFNFTVRSDGHPPIVEIDGVRLHIVKLTYEYKTKTEQPWSGTSIIHAAGYLGEDLTPKRFTLNLIENTVTDVSRNYVTGTTGVFTFDGGFGIEDGNGKTATLVFDRPLRPSVHEPWIAR